MRYFDYEKVAREANLSRGAVSDLCQQMRREFPWDDLLYELHVLRACMAVRDGQLTLEAGTSRRPAIAA
jgi:hypothetical protein